MSKKILLIGQAQPAVVQEYPYSTTLLYTWLEECGISKDQAQEMFEFEAMVDKFPGHGRSGHKVPTEKEMDKYLIKVLANKILEAEKVILLGNVSRDYIRDKTPFMDNEPEKFLCLIHPSKRNYERYMQNKEQIINSLKQFINK